MAGMTESPRLRRIRRQRERLLEKVGVETPEGQRLLEQWHREALRERRGK